MARGASPVPTPLPKVSFVKVEDKSLTEPAGVHDIQARSFGYNDFSIFDRPEHYIRYIEPLEHDLAVQVEYDMDEQDHEWLDAVNADRKKEQLDKVSYETFEIIMDRLEKEWFDLTKTLPKPDMVMPSEDSTCAICDDSEGENTNAIVFCDGCNLAVHQDCYGVPYIPEGQWLCRKCTVSPETPVSCILCPNEGGAFKQTVLGEWVHLLCAIWVPETRVVNEVFMEPITGIDRISKQRWKLRCSVCDIREGSCIQCSKASCFLAFHPTCARKEKLLMPMKAAHGSDAPSLTCYCEKHLPTEQQEARFEALEAERESTPHNESTKTARAYATTYSSGPPLVPAIVVDRIIHYIYKISMRKRNDFVILVCKYWSLKREGRRGAPLLKRLHLEPWTATNSGAGGGKGSEEDKALKLEYMKKLRQDLESVRMISELTRKRENKKLEQAQIIQDVLSRSLYPHESALRFSFEKIIMSDRNEYFKYPVSKADVPDYFDVIKTPLCWNDIDTKLDRHQYWDVQDFKDDIMLVLTNAIKYNKYDTPFNKTAHRIKIIANNTFADLDKKIVPAHLQQSTSTNIGNLEPRLDILETFLSASAIQEDEEMEYILEDGAEPITTLFSYDLGTLKPPPPSPSPPPPPSPPKSKTRTRKGKKERKVDPESITKTEKVFDVEALDTSPGFRAPRTRHGRAAAAAFEAEAEAGPSTSVISEPGSGSISKARAQPPTQAVVPPIVESVDNKQSFKMFDQGWILPENQKRGGRGAVAIESLQTPVPKKSKSKKGKAKDADAMQVDQPSVEEVFSGKGKDRRTVIVIEELDTPATRREKSMKRKAEREEAMRLAQAAMPEIEAEVQPEEVISELSSLSESESVDIEPESEDGDEEVSVVPAVSKTPEKLVRVAPKPSTSVVTGKPGEIILGPGEKLESGTLVWAKADSFPWWPAVIFDPEVGDLIPPRIQNLRHTSEQHLIKFYDKTASWQWVDLSRLKLLGEDDELDKEMIAPTSRIQKWKSKAIRDECRASWRLAMEEMETAEDLEPAIVGESEIVQHTKEEQVPGPENVQPEPVPESAPAEPEPVPEPVTEQEPEPEPAHVESGDDVFMQVDPPESELVAEDLALDVPMEEDVNTFSDGLSELSELSE